MAIITHRELLPESAVTATWPSTWWPLFESFILMSTRPSSPSTELATNLPSPEESEPLVNTRSGSRISSAVSSASSKLYVVNVAAFSMTFRLILSSSLAYTMLAWLSVRDWLSGYLFWSEHDEMRNRWKIPLFSRAISWWRIGIGIAIKYRNQ